MYASFLAKIIRFLKRFLVLVPGLVMAYVGAKNIFPFIDEQIPAWLAILCTYIITAYVLIPLALRIVRLFIKPKHIPLYCTTPDGFASDPINIGLVGTREQVVQAMQAAGWHQSDYRTIKNLWRLGISMLLNKPYPTAPFSSLYLFGRSQDLGFQKSQNGSPRHRHHVRFWAHTNKIPLEYREHFHFWQRWHKDPHPDDTSYLWLGAASLDVGLGIIFHNAQLTHQIHHDTDAERDLIAAELQAVGHTGAIKTTQIAKAYSLRNRTIGGRLVTDGKLTVIELR